MASSPRNGRQSTQARTHTHKAKKSSRNIMTGQAPRSIPTAARYKRDSAPCFTPSARHGSSRGSPLSPLARPRDQRPLQA
eukprot:122916-Hanusia_phi.AAC.1